MPNAVFFMLLLHIASGILEENDTLECTIKEKTISYLDVASEMIEKAKGNYQACPRNKLKPLDCEDLLRSGYITSGTYTIWPKNRIVNEKALHVYCDMDTDGGGWTVIQRRGNFSRTKDYFFQDWFAYKHGFGCIDQDFWLGNDNIFALSNQKLVSVRFDLKDVEGEKRYALFDIFWINSEDSNYTLHIKGYSGDAGDSMSGHSGYKFSTKDRDNDIHPNISCSQTFMGGWWYSKCHAANLNGLYLRGKHDSYADGVVWHSWKGHHESMDTAEIKIRHKDFQKLGKTNFITPQ